MLPGLVEDEGRRSARDAEQFEALADRMIVLELVDGRGAAGASPSASVGSHRECSGRFQGILEFCAPSIWPGIEEWPASLRRLVRSIRGSATGNPEPNKAFQP